ncbi:hypothetical protein SAMN06265220_101103 [Flavobacterium nitrogenifigens]|uniref:Uncharacterized protein n=1 Tax=Flavobacterium nitrogenifigens TaxID=1617283 RepID=A0A521AG89_9FLAO|nr:hypothetical protein SAMN06265220_101103 [Flavobacterium nitrogenifigens]
MGEIIVSKIECNNLNSNYQFIYAFVILYKYYLLKLSYKTI